MSINELRVWVGQVWGRTTTVVLALAAASAGIMADPDVGPGLVKLWPWFPKVAVVLGAAAIILRMFAKKEA